MEETLTSAATCILDCFKSRELRAGALIHFTDFGDAIIWEGGFVRDESIRRAIRMLTEQAYVVEFNTGLKLTEHGEKQIYGEQQPKHGARVYHMGDKLLIQQTILRGTPPEYVIDEHRERHVHENDDGALALAIRDAVRGKL